MSTVEYENLKGITSCIAYPNGQIQTCRLNLPNSITTPYGELVPKYSSPGIRDKELKSISFYENGEVRSICLEEQTDILTPMGVFPAELVTFYEDGELESVFPLNGQIGFGWSEQEEKALSQQVQFDFPFASFEATPIALRFYPDGSLRSVTLWPEEIVPIETPVGSLSVRTGFRLFENGTLQSVEPAFPVGISTPIGKIISFDTNALGMDADMNSLRFDKQGNLSHLVTAGDIIVKNNTNGMRYRFTSQTRMALNDDKQIKMPIQLTFEAGYVNIRDGVAEQMFNIVDCEFLVLSDFTSLGAECGGDCGGCALC